MALDSTAELLFRVSADAGDAEGNIQRFRALMTKDLGAIKAEFEDWSKKVFGAMDSSKGVMLAGGAAIAAGLVAVAAGVKHASDAYVEYVSEVGRASKTTGISAENISVLREVADVTGTNFDALTAGISKFTTKVYEAARSTDYQKTAFAALGISQKEVQAGERDLMGLLGRTGDGLRDLRDKTAQLALAREAFGRGAPELIGALRLGSEGMRELAQEAANAGKIITTQDVAAVRQLRLEMRALEEQREALELQVGRVTAPYRSLGEALKLAFLQSLDDLGGWDFAAKMGARAAKVIGDAQRTARLMSMAQGDKVPVPEPKPDKTVKETLSDYSGLSSLFESVRQKAEGLGSEEEKIASDAQHMFVQLRDAALELGKLHGAGKLTAESYTREMEALQGIPAMIMRWTEGEMTKLGEQRGERILLAEKDLQTRLAGLQEEGFAGQRAAWNREMDETAERMRKERTLTEENERLLGDIRAAGLARIERERAAAFVSELTQLQQLMSGVLTNRMTTEERIRFGYENDLARFSAAREAEALKSAGTEGEAAATMEQFALNRQVLLQRYGQELMILYNSQGWQGVFGDVFGQALRNNEELLREWAESADQAMMMVRVSAEVVEETLRRGFRNFAQGMGQNIAQAIVYKKSIGEAMREAAASTLASIAAESFMYAIYSSALGFVRLAQHDYVAAGQAFTAAAIFGGVGAAAAVAGRMIAPGNGAKEGAAGGGTEAGAAGSQAVGGGSSEPAQTRGPRVQVIVQGSIYGPSGVEEFLEIVNDAVENRDARLVATTTRRGGRATQ